MYKKTGYIFGVIFSFIILSTIVGMNIMKNSSTPATNQVSEEYNKPINPTNEDAKEKENTNINVEPSTPIGDTVIVSTFSTSIKGSSEGRRNNITIASNKITGITLKQNDTFSFNDTVGPTSQNEGYMKSDVLDSDGNVFQGYGGGVCQISTTIYNAVLNLGMEIVERYEHSTPVAYIETGKDATVSYGIKDFKFKNTLSYPIKINIEVTDNDLIVNLLKQ